MLAAALGATLLSVDLTAATTKAVLRTAGSAAAPLSPEVIAVAEGVLRTMFLSRLRTAGFILVVVLSLAAAGVGLAAHRPGAAEPPADAPSGADAARPAALPARADRFGDP